MRHVHTVCVYVCVCGERLFVCKMFSIKLNIQPDVWMLLLLHSLISAHTSYGVAITEQITSLKTIHANEQKPLYYYSEWVLFCVCERQSQFTLCSCAYFHITVYRRTVIKSNRTRNKLIFENGNETAVQSMC